ncbi:hypothetical protein PI126_g24350 [Phytophthora idaei]|nr:hypothetical protein PI126_g24350 [Phytophthora idaei]
MLQLRQPNNAAELSKLTTLRAKKRNVTRWSSTYEMLQRYGTIRPQIWVVEAVEDLVPSTSDHKKLVRILKHLEKLDSVCKRLQCAATTMSEVRLIFDSVVTDYPITGGHLKPTAKIVHSSAFKKRIVKICVGEKLSAAETAALKRFASPRSDEQPGASGRKRKERQDSYSAHVIQQGVSKRCQVERAAYSPLAALVPPTSNACEHLFSECKITLTPQRCSMLPAHFEMLTFLCVNKDMWDVTSLI